MLAGVEEAGLLWCQASPPTGQQWKAHARHRLQCPHSLYGKELELGQELGGLSLECGSGLAKRWMPLGQISWLFYSIS